MEIIKTLICVYDSADASSYSWDVELTLVPRTGEHVSFVGHVDGTAYLLDALVTKVTWNCSKDKCHLTVDATVVEREEYNKSTSDETSS